jgi:hypothetical protein
MIQSTDLLVIMDFVNLRQFDHIYPMIALSVITLSGLLCKILLKIFFKSDTVTIFLLKYISCIIVAN